MQKKPENESFSIKQRKSLFRQQTYTVIEDRIEFESKGLFSLNNFSVPLKEIDPQPTRYKNIPAGWFLLLIITSFMAFIMIITAIYSKEDSIASKVGGTLGSVFIIISAILATKTFNNWVNVWIFSGQGGHLPIWANKPSKKEAEEFAAKLSETIKRSAANKNKRELDFLKLLKSEGLIDEWNYNKAVELFENGRR